MWLTKRKLVDNYTDRPMIFEKKNLSIFYFSRALAIHYGKLMAQQANQKALCEPASFMALGAQFIHIKSLKTGLVEAKGSLSTPC